MEVSDIRAIWKGSYFLDNEHYNSVYLKFKNELKSSPEGKEVYGNCTSNLQRIKFFKQYFSWDAIPIRYYQRFQKSCEISTALRETGNKAYKVKDISNAFRGYNLALCFAPLETEQLGLAFANRAALFLFINEPQFALADVEEALKYKHYDEKMHAKLEDRQAKCIAMKLKQLNNNSDSKSCLNVDDEGQKYCEAHFSNIKSKSRNLNCAEDFLEVIYSAECGRRLVAIKDVPAGTPVLVETPFCTILEKCLTWDTEHCIYCTKPMFGGLPCPECTFGLYCGEECSAKYLANVHKMEHNYFPYLHSTKTFHDHDILLALRILMKTGSSVLQRYFENGTLCPNGLQGSKDDSQNDSATNGLHNEIIAGFNENGVYDSDSYQTVYNLVPHRTEFDFTSLENADTKSDLHTPNEFKCHLLVNVLEETTNFFKDVDISPTLISDYKDFIASLLLQHYENLQYNILSLSEWYAPTLGPISLPLWNAKAKELSKSLIVSGYAVGVFPLVALCNHSCDPNAIFVKHAKINKAAVITSRKIFAGEEILISYKAPFTRMRYEDRQNYLRENYKFDCNCYACSKQYSVQSIIKDPIVKSRNAKESQVVAARLEVLELRLEEAQQLIRKEKFTKAFELLVEESDFLTENFEPNFSSFQVCQDLLRRAVVHLIHT